MLNGRFLHHCRAGLLLSAIVVTQCSKFASRQRLPARRCSET